MDHDEIVTVERFQRTGGLGRVAWEGRFQVVRGDPVLVLEPSCAAMLRTDLPEPLPDDPRAASLARRVTTLAELLDGGSLDEAGDHQPGGHLLHHLDHPGEDFFPILFARTEVEIDCVGPFFDLASGELTDTGLQIAKPPAMTDS